MRARYTVFAALAYLGVTIAVTYPVAFQLTTHIAGLPGSDSLEFIWSTWWFKHALLDLRANPLQIPILNHPDGLYFPLLPAMSQPFLLALPFTLLTSPVVAFNLIYLLSFPLCGLAGYWLCYDLTSDRRAAFIGGLIWAFFPNKSGHALAGHLFQLVVFTLPISALFLLRMFRQPSIRSAVAAGIALAVAATIHPINVAYFLLPLIFVILVYELWPKYPVSLKQWLSESPLKWTLLAALAGGLLSLPLFLPTLLNSRQLTFLAERGVVLFSIDLLAFIIPALNHPLVVNSPLADLARRIVPFEIETVGYIGLVPLALTILSLRWRWRESRVWLILGLLTAILSLGPVLHIGREVVRITVEDDRFPVLMPYAFIGRLPFLQWSRTPDRLNETTMFAVAIMGSLGMAALLSRIKNRKIGWAIWLVVCLDIPFEYIVRWPMPTAPIPSSPALTELARDTSFDAVLNFPVTDYTGNLNALFQQTIHQHPMIGGRVYRDQPGALFIHDFLSRAITATTGSDDIAPGPTVGQRAAALAHFGVSRIIYQPEGDPDGSARAALGALFGAPVATEESLSVYSVPSRQSPITDPFFVFGANWYAPEQWQAPTRWFSGRASVYIFSDTDKTGALAFTAIPGDDLRRLIVNVNGVEAARFGVGDWAEYRTSSVTLHKGLNTIEFFDENGSWQYVGDPRCQNGSAVAGPFPFDIPCDANNREARDLSLAIQNLRFVPEAAQYSAQATFGGTFELLDVSAPAEVQPGDTITLHFTWRAAVQPKEKYTLFVHLLDANGQLVVGNDGVPARGSHPTARWQVGQINRFNVPLTVPPDTPPGLYSLSVGWYSWPSLDRLPLPGGASTFTVGTLEIAP
ncbi:MAG TPA: hypothetical protein VJL59_10075 [Anaerolineales bacterium]|nr:hypothetical protein [Anaerolineales bacterium]